MREKLAQLKQHIKDGTLSSFIEANKPQEDTQEPTPDITQEDDHINTVLS
jgi:hypothetical protein